VTLTCAPVAPEAQWKLRELPEFSLGKFSSLPFGERGVAHIQLPQMGQLCQGRDVRRSNLRTAFVKNQGDSECGEFQCLRFRFDNKLPPRGGLKPSTPALLTACSASLHAGFKQQRMKSLQRDSLSVRHSVSNGARALALFMVSCSAVRLVSAARL